MPPSPCTAIPYENKTGTKITLIEDKYTLYKVYPPYRKTFLLCAHGGTRLRTSSNFCGYVPHPWLAINLRNAILIKDGRKKSNPLSKKKKNKKGIRIIYRSSRKPNQLVAEKLSGDEASSIEPTDLPSPSPSNQSSSISRWKTLERRRRAIPVSLVPLNPSQPPHIPRWIKRSSSGSVPPVKSKVNPVNRGGPVSEHREGGGGGEGADSAHLLRGQSHEFMWHACCIDRSRPATNQ